MPVDRAAIEPGERSLDLLAQGRFTAADKDAVPLARPLHLRLNARHELWLKAGEFVQADPARLKEILAA